MKPSPPVSLKRRPREQAVAIVLVLAFLVLLTGLVVAFFSRTMDDRQIANSDVAQTKAEILARSALSVVVGDFQQEIAKSSSTTTIGSTTIYTCTNSVNMVPARGNWPGYLISQTGTNDPVPNLIRISSTMALPVVAGAAPAAVSATASASSSTGTSANLRSISPARWNQHYLLGLANNGATYDSTPAAFPAPAWVMVTSGGPTVLTAPSTSVIGRYAYAVYDEGGLLDANVVGVPNVTGTALSWDLGHKGSLAFADLANLSGTSPTTGTMGATAVNNLVGYRNYVTAQAGGTFGNYTFTTAAESSYSQYVTSSTTGFMTVNGTTGVGGRTDQLFPSRAALIKYQRAAGTTGSSGFNVNLLQYLGTFSRETNAPSFYYPAPGTAGLAANDPVSNTTNPNILTLRMSGSGVALDGYAWLSGDPVVGRRFPLSRLGLLTYSATNTSTTSPIAAYFGLYRASISAPWLYVGSSGGATAASGIETLSQVAAETPSREPNFFELLKAAIHKDSIGVSTGFFGNTDPTWVGHTDAVDGLGDLQILRIGANIINQASPDNYPRVIAYNAAGTLMYAYGIADLPYIQALGLRVVSSWNSSISDTGSNRQLQDQFVPVLWNPHRSLGFSGPGPSQIDYYMTGATRYYLLQDTGGTPSTNDTLGYINPGRPRMNEMGLSGFSQPAACQNKGSIVIPSANFSSFYTPSLISATMTGISVSSGTNYGILPYHTDQKIYGLTLANPPYSTPRAPQTSETAPYWNGYGNNVNTPAHHLLNPGVNQVGINAVLRFLGPDGVTWQVYNAFCSGEADPNGAVNTNYDQFGICPPSNNATDDGLFCWLFSPTRFPLAVSPNYADATSASPQWAMPGGSVGNGDRNFGQNEVVSSRSLNEYFVIKPDPRTARFGLGGGFHGWSLDSLCKDITQPILNPSDAYAASAALGGKWFIAYGYPALASVPSGNTYNCTSMGGGIPNEGSGNPGVWFPAMWSVNSATLPNPLSSGSGNYPGTYYYDKGPSGLQSGKVRPGDDYFTYLSGLANTSGTTGTNNTYEPSPGVQSPAQPIILHRPFRNVGELGYAFRDMPYKSLDMASTLSVDAALLDFFTVEPSIAKMAAGRVNANTRQVPVLQAIMSSEFRAESLAMGSFNGPMAPSAAATIAQGLVTVTATNPLFSRADLVTRLAMASGSSTVFNGASTAASPFAYPSIKSQREAPVRALADSTQARTWTLLIDVIAQSGRYPAGATDLTKGFVVEGERRYWLHVAIDRFTGQIIDQQLEPVYE